MNTEAADYGKRFRDHWKRFLERFKITSDLQQNVFSDLWRRYGEKHRIYHGIKHPVLLLDELEIVRRDVPQWFTGRDQDLAIELAIWNNGVVYNTRRRDNKEKSSERVLDHAHDLGISAIVGAEAALVVLATKHLKKPVALSAQIVTDIDLSLLASPWETFVRNTLDIREEYRPNVSDNDWRTGRKDFLEGMAKWSSIYTTNYFFMKYEVRAQANILRSYRETFTN